MANLVSTTITGTLNTTSTITGPGSGVSAINASNVSSGTLASDRLPTVPTSKGGTGLTTIGSAGQVLKVAAPGSALEFGDAGGGGDYELTLFTGPGTWTKDTGLKAVKVTVIGGGGGGGGAQNVTTQADTPGGSGGGAGGSVEFIPAPSIPGPVSVTVGSGGTGGGAAASGNGGGTSSFGAFLSATGGSGGNTGGNGANDKQGGAGGAGSGGQINITGQRGNDGISALQPATNRGWTAAEGGNGAFGFGLGGRGVAQTRGPTYPGRDATGYGGGGGAGQASTSDTQKTGGSGSGGLVIVEEFY